MQEFENIINKLLNYFILINMIVEQGNSLGKITLRK